MRIDDFIDRNAINNMLEELLLLEQEVKVKMSRIHQIKDWCKVFGSFSTNTYVCSVQDRERTCLAPLAVVSKALGEELLRQHKLIKTSKFQTVHVSLLNAIIDAST